MYDVYRILPTFIHPHTDTPCHCHQTTKSQIIFNEFHQRRVSQHPVGHFIYAACFPMKIRDRKGWGEQLDLCTVCCCRQGLKNVHPIYIIDIYICIYPSHPSIFENWLGAPILSFGFMRGPCQFCLNRFSKTKVDSDRLVRSASPLSRTTNLPASY